MPTPAPRPVVDPSLLNRAGTDAQWTNLGFWLHSHTYEEAATELARRVGRAAGLREGDVVLDVACGHGDSLALWVREFGVARVIGVEPDPAIVAAVEARVDAWGLGDRITLKCGAAETLDIARECPGVTAVVCVDAAYHFDTRAKWLRRVAGGVAPETRLGLADLLVPMRPHASRSVAFMSRRARIPVANHWAAQDVESALSECGWRSGRLVRCGPEVLGGFVKFAFGSAPAWALKPRAGGWRALATAVAIAGAKRGGRLDYLIVEARSKRPATPPFGQPNIAAQ